MTNYGPIPGFARPKPPVSLRRRIRNWLRDFEDTFFTSAWPWITLLMYLGFLAWGVYEMWQLGTLMRPRIVAWGIVKEVEHAFTTLYAFSMAWLVRGWYRTDSKD